MGRVGLTAFLEASGEEVRLAHAQRWFGIALLASGFALGLVVILAVALTDTSHQIAVLATFSVLALLACGFAWWAYYEYVRPHVKRESRVTQDHGDPPAELTHPVPPQPVLQPEHAWVLLPAAVLALLYPRVTLRMLAGMLALWRGASNASTLPHEPPPR